MWSRAELKERGKKSFKRVYASAVIVCLIVSVLEFAFSGGNSSSNAYKNVTQNYNSEEYVDQEVVDGNNEVVEKYIENNTLLGKIDSIFSDENNSYVSSVIVTTGIMAIVLICIVVGFLAMIVKAIILNPIKVGRNNYFMGIRESERNVKDILFLFSDKNFIKTTITIFLKDLYITLWTLLLVIPGIIKSYEYRMIPYILSENTNIDRARAFEISKEMMNGQKYNAFVLDLSFFGWYLLSVFTFGILDVLYINPYVEATNAELYAFLREDALQRGCVTSEELPGFLKIIR